MLTQYFPSDPPEIEVDTNKVHSGEKKEAHLTCIVRGNPVPKVRGLDHLVRGNPFPKVRGLE